jgi:hypothetical protein
LGYTVSVEMLAIHRVEGEDLPNSMYEASGQ